ncbi:hypothetical protein ACNSPD_21740 [Yersinia enterocolitica]|uniref:hypothetical protein n=1 Tax=Yersinia TaxID=629 RepID=UPI003AB40CA6
MDITKSQSDFEAWVVTWWPQSKTMIAEKFDDGGYWNMPLQQYFEAWKASRESIEVELPAKITFKDTYWASPNKMREALVLSLRTTGILIKGESE